MKVSFSTTCLISGVVMPPDPEKPSEMLLKPAISFLKFYFTWFSNRSNYSTNRFSLLSKSFWAQNWPNSDLKWQSYDKSKIRLKWNPMDLVISDPIVSDRQRYLRDIYAMRNGKTKIREDGPVYSEQTIRTCRLPVAMLTYGTMPQ